MIRKQYISPNSVCNFDMDKSKFNDSKKLASLKYKCLLNYKESITNILSIYYHNQNNYHSLNTYKHIGFNTYPSFFNKFSQSYDPEFFTREMIESMDPNTLSIEDHSKQVSEYAFQLGMALGLKDEELEKLKIAGLLHDIGKTSIPNKILDKETSLDSEEWKIMKTHTLVGYDILKSNEMFKDIAYAARWHHERMDGKGYPVHLKGHQIPLFARIISVVDAYEAMTSDRPYRKALSKEIAIGELIKNSGTQFDSKLVPIFIEQVLN